MLSHECYYANYGHYGPPLTAPEPPPTPQAVACAAPVATPTATIYRTARAAGYVKRVIVPPKDERFRFFTLLRLLEQAIFNDVEVTRVRPSQWRPTEALYFTVTSQRRGKQTGKPAITYTVAIWADHGCTCTCARNRDRTWATAHPCAHLAAAYANLLGWRDALGAPTPDAPMLSVPAQFAHEADHTVVLAALAPIVAPVARDRAAILALAAADGADLFPSHIIARDKATGTKRVAQVGR